MKGLSAHSSQIKFNNVPAKITHVKDQDHLSSGSANPSIDTMGLNSFKNARMYKSLKQNSSQQGAVINAMVSPRETAPVNQITKSNLGGNTKKVANKTVTQKTKTTANSGEKTATALQQAIGVVQRSGND